jgi:spore germination protein
MSRSSKFLFNRLFRSPASEREIDNADPSSSSSSSTSSSSSSSSSSSPFRFIDDLHQTYLDSSLDVNEQFLTHLFEDCSDVLIRPFQLHHQTKALFVFVDGLIQTQFVNEAMKALMLLDVDELTIEHILHQDLPISQASLERDYAKVLVGILSGDTCLLVDGQQEAILIGMRGPVTRSISEPETESVIRGPREGFVENLRVNTSLLRRKIKTPQLKMKPLLLGKQSNTNVVVAYMHDIANPELVDEVITRLHKINIDGVLESGYIEELIQDDAYSPFPQIQYTERPDVVASALLQGRVAMILDGTPFVLIVPFVFVNILQASEDYYERFQISSLLRWLRYIFLFLSLTAPALYVAITTFHHELLPTSLLLSIAASREAIPFPAVVEAFIMEISFEALREAGVRLPKAIGSAVSILGALVIGQAAVQAGIVSAPMVIVISITGIASFTIPRYNGAIALRMLRFPVLIAASIFGIYGIFLCLFLLVGHLASLRSFGIPYLSPLAPFSSADLKDVIIRAPLWQMKERPSFLSLLDSTRMDSELPDEIRKHGGLQHTSPSTPTKVGHSSSESEP